MMHVGKGRLIFSLTTCQGIKRCYKIFHFLITHSRKSQLVLIKRMERQHLTRFRKTAYERASIYRSVICHLQQRTFPHTTREAHVCQHCYLGLPAYFISSTQIKIVGEKIQCLPLSYLATDWLHSICFHGAAVTASWQFCLKWFL